MKNIFYLCTCLLLITGFSCGVNSASQNTQVTNQSKDSTPATTQATVVNEILKDTLQFREPDGYCNDWEQVLTLEEIKELDSICSSYDKTTTNQIVIVTTKTFGDFPTIEEYSTALFNEWKIGTKEKNNGLLMVVSADAHRVRLATGLGTEKVLTNDICENIIGQYIIPKFKKNKVFAGIKSGLNECIKRWK